VKNFIEYYMRKGHTFGECMSHQDTNLMYVNIPKNASSWTKPNLQDWGWEHFNYHTDNLYHKHALVVLRDPIQRWLSGIAQYMFLYHKDLNINFTPSFLDIIFDRIAFDDHTDRQILFLQKLNFDNCTFFWCNKRYRELFSTFLHNHGMPNRYNKYEYQNVNNEIIERKRFFEFFSTTLYANPKYINNLKEYFVEDYQLINSVQFYAG